MTINFLNTTDVAKLLNITRDQVVNLIHSGLLVSRQIGSRGDYIIHPVDYARANYIRNVQKLEQSSLKPDFVWVWHACEFLLEAIRASEFKPQIVVGIAHGGIIPSLISAKLRFPLVYFKTIHYDCYTQLSTVTFVDPTFDFQDVATLIVDDLVDTGETISVVHEYIHNVGVSYENLRTAVLHKKLSSVFIPDWYVDIISDWVDYPWEDVDA